MSTTHFLDRLRRLLFGQKKQEQQKTQRNLRLIQLEDRRVLNASLAFNAGITLEANGSAGESLTIEDGGMFDVGGGDVETVLLKLSGGTWNNSSGVLGGGLMIICTIWKTATQHFE